MQISEISFADKIAYNIKADDTKKYILDNLEKRYNLKIISKHHERFDEKFISSINNNPHLLCAKSNGNPYFLHMVKYNFINYCVFIDKKIQQGYYYPRMIICNFHFADSLFDDTVMEGEMVKTNSGRWLFLINDLLVIKGNYLNESNIIKRMNILYETMDKDFIYDNMDICKFAIKKYFKYDQLSDLMNNHIPKLPYTCRGIYFKPLFLRFREILVNFDDSVVKKVDRKKYKNTGNFLLKEDTPEIIVKQEKQVIIDNKVKTFNARKTSNPDIYELFDITTNIQDGMACIPTMKISKYMRQLFETKNVVDKVEIKCEYSEKFNKWIPLIL
jgi:hypothetical protein